jgi:hypothetical protein
VQHPGYGRARSWRSRSVRLAGRLRSPWGPAQVPGVGSSLHTTSVPHAPSCSSGARSTPAKGCLARRRNTTKVGLAKRDRSGVIGAPSHDQCDVSCGIRNRRSVLVTFLHCARSTIDSDHHIHDYLLGCGASPRGHSCLQIVRARSSFEPLRGEIPAGGFSYEGQTVQTDGRHLVGYPAKTSKRYG